MLKSAKITPPVVPEKLVQAQLMRRLREAGLLVVRVNSGTFKGQARNYFRAYSIENMPAKYASCGLPDILAMIDGRVILVEVKTDKGQLSESQERFHAVAQTYGIKILVCRGESGINETMDAVLDWIRTPL